MKTRVSSWLFFLPPPQAGDWEMTALVTSDNWGLLIGEQLKQTTTKNQEEHDACKLSGRGLVQLKHEGEGLNLDRHVSCGHGGGHCGRDRRGYTNSSRLERSSNSEIV